MLLGTLLLALVALTSPGLSAAAPPALPDFSADQDIVLGGKTTDTAKLAVSGPRTRYENTTAGRKMTVLTDRDAKKSWITLPPPIGCLVGAARSDVKDDLFPGGGAAKEEVLGKETVDGHPTEKVKRTWTADGKPADTGRVEAYLSDLRLLAAEELMDHPDAAALKRYGLDKPSWEFEVASSSGTALLAVGRSGDPRPVQRKGVDAVYMVPDYRLEPLQKAAKDFLAGPE